MYKPHPLQPVFHALGIAGHVDAVIIVLRIPDVSKREKAVVLNCLREIREELEQVIDKHTKQLWHPVSRRCSIIVCVSMSASLSSGK